jgi:DEAD/DEAH box helicase domain-containing protein
MTKRRLPRAISGALAAFSGVYESLPILHRFMVDDVQQHGTAQPRSPLIPHIRLDRRGLSLLRPQPLSALSFRLVAAGIPVPRVEYYHDQLADDLFAELAWPDLDQPVAVLVGDQAAFASQWQAGGWLVVTLDDLQATGVTLLVEMISGRVVGV